MSARAEEKQGKAGGKITRRNFLGRAGGVAAGAMAIAGTAASYKKVIGANDRNQNRTDRLQAPGLAVCVG